MTTVRSAAGMGCLASAIANLYVIYANPDLYRHFRSQTSRGFCLMRPIPQITPINQRRCVYRVQPGEVQRLPRRRTLDSYVKIFLIGFVAVSVILVVISGLSGRDKKDTPMSEAKPSVQSSSTGIIRMGEVLGNQVNIREAPSLRSKVLGQVNEGISLRVLGFSRGWYKIEMKDIGTAYIFSAYLRPVNFDTGEMMLGIVKHEKAQVYINVGGVVKKIALPGKTKLLLFPAKGNNKEDFYLIYFPDGSQGYIGRKDVQRIL